MIPLRGLCHSWHSQRLSLRTAAQATTCVVSCIRLMRDAADDHQLELSDWHWDNLGFSYPGSAAVLLAWCGTKVTSATAYQRCKRAWGSFVVGMSRHQEPVSEEWEVFWKEMQIYLSGTWWKEHAWAPDVPTVTHCDHLAHLLHGLFALRPGSHEPPVGPPTVLHEPPDLLLRASEGDVPKSARLPRHAQRTLNLNAETHI